MKRKDFIKNTFFAVAGTSMMYGNSCASEMSFKKLKSKGSKPVINAYYFRAHMYTLVPEQIKKDMQWMAKIGTDVVSIAILEQDLWAAVENVEIIIKEAHRNGMKVFLVPSRWGGLFAGAPKVPSFFSVKNPQTWVLKANGDVKHSMSSGVVSSIHYNETYQFIIDSLKKCLSLWDVQGIVWDEPKSYNKDYSLRAIERLGKEAPLEEHIAATVDFHGKINTFIKEKYPHVTTSLFAHANSSDIVVNLASRTKGVDYFGCDGRPWYNEDGGVQEAKGKVLLGNDAGERFLSATKNTGKKSLWLIENHNLSIGDMEIYERGLEKVMTKDIDQLIYYYYPRSLENPNEVMDVMAKYITQKKL